MDEEEEDLSKIEWGAGLSKLIFAEYPNLIFFFLGWSVLALPSYLGAGIDDHYLDHGTEEIFPIVLSSVFLVLCAVLFCRLRSPMIAAQRRAAAAQRGGMNAPMLAASGIDASWRGVLGFRVHSMGAHVFIESAALWSATFGFIGLGWASGLTTFCAYDKAAAEPPIDPHSVYWQECYEFSRVWHVAYYRKGGTPSHLPPLYFKLLLAALVCAVGGVTLWLILFKLIRQAVRPAREHSTGDPGLRELPQTAMFGLAASVGVIAGAGAWVFRQMIGLVHNVFFMQPSLTTSPFSYDANAHTPPPYEKIPLPLIILSPIVGGLIVAFLVQNWAPEAKGHGVPEVMDAIHYKKGKIRPSVAGVKILACAPSAEAQTKAATLRTLALYVHRVLPALAAPCLVAASCARCSLRSLLLAWSAWSDWSTIRPPRRAPASFSIGSGGSVGREGPIIQIGSTFGSMVGVASRCSVSQRVTLIACGAAGGIAATFNTPSKPLPGIEQPLPQRTFP